VNENKVFTQARKTVLTLLNLVLPQQGNNDNEPPTYQEATAGYEDMEAQFAWDDKVIRQTFIRKVYAILMVQLLVTVGIISLFTFCAPVRYYIQTHPGLYMASYLMFFATYIALSCCGDLREKPSVYVDVCYVYQYMYMLCFLRSFYNTKSVVLCVGITALVCLSVTIFSFQTKIDVTSCQGVLFSLCIVMLLCAITISIVVPFGYVPWLHATYAVGGAILFTLFLAFDTQMLLGNKRYTISPEEYIFATLAIYLDIIYLFSFLLQITGGGRD
uniref:Protein lifeguard 2 n=1 Tax=Sphaeramia orbicularis TaxID=375764 RepID=A0A673BFC8_9TELE